MQSSGAGSDNYMKNGMAYIVGIESIAPKRIPAEYLADCFYPKNKFGEKINGLAKKMVSRLGVKERSLVIDCTAYPELRLADEADQPKNWGKILINRLLDSTGISGDEIGFLSISYNVSSHIDTLPNLASQIVMGSGLNNVDQCEEVANYGCASSIHCFDQAVDFCVKNNRAAIVIALEQCSFGFHELSEENENFKKSLVTSLLFTDGAVGVLILPEARAIALDRPLMRIDGIKKKYQSGDLIKMIGGNFIMDSRLKDIMPPIVSNFLVKPFLKDMNLQIGDIDEWSIHQGGTDILQRFCDDDCLGLLEEKIDRSLKMYSYFGNTSTASCLFVLESFFKDRNNRDKRNRKGLIVGFGAGYYLGALAYSWCY